MSEYTVSEVINFVKENDVKFIRLAFCDVFGRLKNISIMPSELERAFSKGIAFDASAVEGFMHVEESDLFLLPDPSTMQILPWRPSQGRVVRFFCDITLPEGKPFQSNTRNILKEAIGKAKSLGYSIKVGTECEFYLFELDDKGMPTLTPNDNAGYCDVAPSDKGENVRREICLTLEEMGLMPEMSHHEQGPGQHEVDFRYSDALQAADNLINFKSVVKNVAARNGLYASFMPKPLLNHSGSGLHINISISKNGENIFSLGGEERDSISAFFTAGIMKRIPDITVFTNPVTNSYSRLGEFSAPKFITWSHGNRSQLVRIPASYGEYKRMELRSPDPACSPYLALALLIHAGIEGIINKEELPPPSNINMYNASKEEKEKLKLMPLSLGEAIEIAEKSEFLRTVLPEITLSRYLKVKKEEHMRFVEAKDKHKDEIERYFEKI